MALMPQLRYKYTTVWSTHITSCRTLSSLLPPSMPCRRFPPWEVPKLKRDIKNGKVRIFQSIWCEMHCIRSTLTQTQSEYRKHSELHEGHVSILLGLIRNACTVQTYTKHQIDSHSHTCMHAHAGARYRRGFCVLVGWFGPRIRMESELVCA